MREIWNNRKVLVTGATGFLGSWLVQNLLETEAEVTTILRDSVPRSNFHILELQKKINIVTGSITDLELVKRAINEYSIDTIFHLAAQSQVLTANRSPLSTFETNIQGTWNILEAARQLGVARTIIASSDKAYGPQKQLPYYENTPMNGLYPYDVSKSCADMIARSYFSTFALPVAVVRCANLYGGGDYNFDRIIPGTIRDLLIDKSPIIRSDGTPERDYMFVEDAVRGYMMVAENMDKEEVLGQAFNMGTGKSLSAKNVVSTIIKHMNKDIEPTILLRGKIHAEIDRQYLASDRAERVFGWKPEYSFEDGLRKTIEWYQSNL